MRWMLEMTACEKCWKDSGGDHARYKRLLKGRHCTPEEQAGDDAGLCPDCGRRTVHQHTGDCLSPECWRPAGLKKRKDG